MPHPGQTWVISTPWSSAQEWWLNELVTSLFPGGTGKKDPLGTQWEGGRVDQFPETAR